MELERRHKQEVHNTKYFMPNYHIVSITPLSPSVRFLKQKGMGPSEAIAAFQERNVIKT